MRFRNRRFRFSLRPGRRVRRPRRARRRRGLFGIRWPIFGRRKIVGIPLGLIVAFGLAYAFIKPVKTFVNRLFNKK